MNSRLLLFSLKKLILSRVTTDALLVLNIKMLLHFYLVCFSFILLFLIVALIQKKREIIVRVITLLTLMHITCLAIWQGTLAFTIFITVILVLSLYEISQNYQINFTLFWLLNLFLFIVAYFSDRNFIELIAFWVVIVSWLVLKGSQDTIKLGSYLFVFASCFLIPCSIFLIRLIDISIAPIVTILLLLQLNDAFGYLFGKQFGKTKLFPIISPNKTLEGYLFGGIGIVIGILLLHTYIPVLSDSIFYKDIFLFFSILILGNSGDLILSALKRKLEIKDFSKILPGHGGVLDRFDNVLFTAPFFYILVNHNFIL